MCVSAVSIEIRTTHNLKSPCLDQMSHVFLLVPRLHLVPGLEEDPVYVSAAYVLCVWNVFQVICVFHVMCMYRVICAFQVICMYFR